MVRAVTVSFWALRSVIPVQPHDFIAVNIAAINNKRTIEFFIVVKFKFE